MADDTRRKTTFNDVLRDVLLASINKGQLPILSVFLILLVLVIKLPSDKVVWVFEKAITALEHYHILGWVLTAFTTVGWFFTAKSRRRVHSGEMTRIANEKSLLQVKEAKKTLSTTKAQSKKK